MKKQTRLKTFLISMAMAFVMLLPMTMNAQSGGSDGFFKSGGDENYRDPKISSGLGLGGMTQEDPAPLGSGLLILTAIGAGYATLKRKQS